MLQFYIILLLHAVRPCFSPLQTLREELVTQGGKQSSAACSLTDSERTAPPLVHLNHQTSALPSLSNQGFLPFFKLCLTFSSLWPASCGISLSGETTSQPSQPPLSDLSACDSQTTRRFCKGRLQSHFIPNPRICPDAPYSQIDHCVASSIRSDEPSFTRHQNMHLWTTRLVASSHRHCPSLFYCHNLYIQS